MDFSEAIHFVKNGEMARRKKWDEDTFIMYVNGLRLPFYGLNSISYEYTTGKECILDSQPNIAMLSERKTFTPGWTPSQEDMLSDDWIIINKMNYK